MPRMKPVDDQQASETASLLFEGIRKKVGMVPNIYRVMANEPAVLAGNLAMNEALSKGTFDTKTREAIALTTAGANDCGYCASAHTALSKGLKVENSEIESRLQGLSGDPKLQAILQFALAVILTRGFVSTLEIETAKSAGLSDGEIMETVGNVVANILTNYVNHIAETDIDFPVVTLAPRLSA